MEVHKQNRTHSLPNWKSELLLTHVHVGVAPDGVELDKDVGDGAEEVAEDHDHRQLHSLDLGVRYRPREKEEL